VQVGAQAIAPELTAIRSGNRRLTRRVPGSQSWYRTAAVPGADTSSRPEAVPWSMTYPRGSLRRGPGAAPDTLTCCAVPTAAGMTAPAR